MHVEVDFGQCAKVTVDDCQRMTCGQPFSCPALAQMRNSVYTQPTLSLVSVSVFQQDVGRCG